MSLHRHVSVGLSYVRYLKLPSTAPRFLPLRTREHSPLE